MDMWIQWGGFGLGILYSCEFAAPQCFGIQSPAKHVKRFDRDLRGAFGKFDNFSISPRYLVSTDFFLILYIYDNVDMHFQRTKNSPAT